MERGRADNEWQENVVGRSKNIDWAIYFYIKSQYCCAFICIVFIFSSSVPTKRDRKSLLYDYDKVKSN